ncbi:MAG: pyrroline-5-carboxylate reductase family protein [Thermoleophilaceae bacterium]
MRVGLIGAGNMASALARGLGLPVVVSDVVHEKAAALAQDTGGEAVASNAEVAKRSDVLVLCHKPAQLDEVAGQVAGRVKLVVSILAAVTTAEVEARYPGVPVYRFIPNIPAEVGRGVLCYTPGSRAADGPEREILELFGRAGLVIRLDDEELLEPAMALMSCGPAFMALVAESFVDAGVHHGLSRADAARMIAETMAGTAEYLKANDLDTEALRVRVATPGGVTERGLIKLEEGAMRAVCRLAVDTVVEATR